MDTEWSKPARYEGEPWNQILGFLLSSRCSVSSPHWSHVDLLPHITSISNAKLHERTDVSSKAEIKFFFNLFLIHFLFFYHMNFHHILIFFFLWSLICSASEHRPLQRICFFCLFFWLILFFLILFVFRSLIITVNIKSCLLAGLILFFPLPGMSVCFGHCMFNYSCTLLPQFIPTN